MKKFFTIILLIVALTTTGCTSDGGRLDMKDSGMLTEIEEGIVYDVNTKIVYCMNTTYNAFVVITPFYGENKELLTKDEYIERYKEITND